MTNRLAYRADLQLLRGVSILLVFFYHLKINGFQNGFLGVDIFFVLSGFLMARLADKVSPFEFYVRRLKRLLPAYFVVVLLSSLAVIYVALPVDANQRLNRLFYDLVGLSNFAFWAENSYFSSSSFKPLLNFWSLAVELQFYLLAPFLLPFLHKRKFILILIIFTSLLLSMAILTVSPKTSFFMLPTRLWEFLFGAYAAWFALKDSKEKITHRFRLVALSSLLAVIFLYPLPTDSLFILTGHPSVAAFIVVISTTVILNLGLDKIVSINSWLSQILIKLGDYSYSVYLVHFPIIVLVNYSEFGGTTLGYKNIFQLITIIILTIVSSFLLYNYVEKLRYTKNTLISIFVLVVACFLLGIFGIKLNKLNYSENEILIFNAWKDKAPYRCGKLSRIFNLKSKICLIGEDLNGDGVLLLGNSHADSIKTTFQKSMEDKGITTYFYVANNPLTPSQNAEVIKNEILLNGINSIVIHYHPIFYGIDINVEIMKDFVELMSEIDISVRFIAPVPVYKHHVPKMMLQLLNEPISNFLLTDYKQYKIDTEGFYEFLNDSNISQENVWYPHTIYCPESECAYQKNGVPYYFDSGHLTLTGARELQPFFNEIGSQLLSNN